MSDDVTPRVLTRYDLYDSDGTLTDRAWEAITPRGAFNGGKFHDETPVGYAEFTPNTRIGRHTDAKEFQAEVEEKAVYVHWKSVWEDVDES